MINHCSKNHDIYIGRPKSGRDWGFGNPFVIGVDGTRAEVIEKYRNWLEDKWIATCPNYHKYHWPKIEHFSQVRMSKIIGNINENPDLLT